MTDAAAIIGIDLGTTHSAIAWLDRAAAMRGSLKMQGFKVQQLVGEKKIDKLPLLPSVLFLRAGFEAGSQDDGNRLPWESPGSPIVGRYARERGADQPARMVASAKSWLCHAGVDRTANILPWGSPRTKDAKEIKAEEEAKISPVAAQAAVLRHLREAWDAEKAPDSDAADGDGKAVKKKAGGKKALAKKPTGGKSWKFVDQDVVLAIPASFDEVARELTLQAALEAGYNVDRLTLLEEPLAALYAWICRQSDEDALGLTRSATILVVDVGGGTTDLTLVEAKRAKGSVQLRRVAVGEHLLLGGDNMDLALAVALEAELAAEGNDKGDTPTFSKQAGKKLPLSQWNHLLLRTRDVKEALIDAAADESRKLVLAGSGSSLIKGTKSISVAASKVQQIVLDGFWPLVEPHEPVKRRASSLGLTEWGLPYAADPVITRHLAAFLRAHAGETASQVELKAPDGSTVQLARPDFVLFNGGVFHSAKIRDRVLEQLNAWLCKEKGARKIAELRVSEPGKQGADADRDERLDHAVALGAAYYGTTRLGTGIAVQSGTAHALYIGVGSQTDDDADEAASTKAKKTVQGVCLIPRDFEEGGELELAKPEFELIANRPVSFPIYSAASRRDKPGDVVQLEIETIRALPPIHTVLRTGRDRVERRIPVRLAARVNSIGTLDLFCRGLTEDPETGKPWSWKLAFNLRPPTAQPKSAAEALERREQQDREPAAATGKMLQPTRLTGTGKGTPAMETIQPARAVHDVSWDAIHGPLRDTFTVPVKNPQPGAINRQLEEVLRLKRADWGADLCRFVADQLLVIGPEARRISSISESRWFNLTGFGMRPGFGFVGDDLRVEQAWAFFEQGLVHSNDKQNETDWWVFWRRVGTGLDKNRQVILFNATCNAAPSGVGLQLASANEQTRRKAERNPTLRPPGHAAEALRLVSSLERVPKPRKIAVGEMLLRRLDAGVGGEVEYWCLARLASREPLHATADVVIPPEASSAWVRHVLQHHPPPSPGSSAVFFLVQAARLTGDRARDVDDSLRGLIQDLLIRLRVHPEAVRPLEEVRRLETTDMQSMAGEALPHGLVLRED